MPAVVVTPERPCVTAHDVGGIDRPWLEEASQRLSCPVKPLTDQADFLKDIRFRRSTCVRVKDRVQRWPCAVISEMLEVPLKPTMSRVF